MTTEYGYAVYTPTDCLTAGLVVDDCKSPPEAVMQDVVKLFPYATRPGHTLILVPVTRTSPSSTSWRASGSRPSEVIRFQAPVVPSFDRIV